MRRLPAPLHVLKIILAGVGPACRRRPDGGCLVNIDIEHFKARLLQDALTEATAQYWVQRAYQFQQAAPRKGDFHGNATKQDLWERWQECMDTAQACLSHADLIRRLSPEPISDEVRHAPGEVA